LRVRKVSLITGAGRGFGRALTETLLDEGWLVLALVRNADAARSLPTTEPSRCIPVIGDVCSDAVAVTIADAVRAAGGRVDLLVNNAGTGGVANDLDSGEAPELIQLFDVHCLGVLRCTKAALPFLLESRTGIVVNLSSRLGSLWRNASGEFAGHGFSYSYRVAKAAQNMLRLCLAQEVGARGVSVCAMHPGRLLTDSGSEDADTSPLEAARNFTKWLKSVGAWVNGRYFDLEHGEQQW
jgi:NAD(P)-dependent dehydrogenase (short-subunit alcohol dehydrogenase family)